MNQPLEVTNFSKGMTDKYLAGPVNAGQLFDNLLLNNNDRPFSRPGSIIRDSTDDQIPSGIKRIGYLLDHRDQIFEISERNLYYFTTSYQTLLGPTSNSGLGDGTGTTEDNHVSAAYWNNHHYLVSDSFCKPVKIYKPTSSTFAVRNAGLPAMTAPTVTAGAAGANNYIYAFHYFYSYVVEGVTFEESGATELVTLSNAAAPDSNAVAITNIPVITNGTSDNYDTTVIKVKIYRTENNLTTLKYIGEVTNGTTTYNDSASDSSITNAVSIYTTGGVVDNDPPPPAKFIHVASNFALYGHVKEGSVVYPNRLRQSLQDDIDSCPEDFYLDMPDEIFGISSHRGTFIVFCKNSTYRVDGAFDELGRGGLAYEKISDTVGTVSNDSIVQTDIGVFFAAKQGFYYTDGFRVIKITEHLDETYSTLVTTDSMGRNIWGAFDKLENRIWWTTQRSESATDNDSCFILDLAYGVNPESTFTTASNGSSFRPTALLFKDRDMYRADTRGYLFKHNEDYLSDPLVDTTKLASVWAKKTIIWNYLSCAFDFGTGMVRKFVPKISVTLENVTNIALQIVSINDDGKSELELSQIRYNSNIVWGDPDIIWGDDTIIWNQRGLIKEKRWMPATGLRCSYKQIRMTNAYTVVERSDLLTTATVDSTANTATLNSASYAWDTNAVGYYLSFENDLYVNQFEVTTRNSDTVLTFLDALAQSPTTGSYKWLLKGYRKDEFFELVSYVIHYKMLSDSEKSFHNPADTGENV